MDCAMYFSITVDVTIFAVGWTKRKLLLHGRITIPPENQWFEDVFPIEIVAL